MKRACQTEKFKTNKFNSLDHYGIIYQKDLFNRGNQGTILRRHIMPTIFGVSHILFLLISTTFIVIGLIIFKKHIKTRNTILISTAFLLLISIILNRLSLTFARPDGINYTELIPMTICGTTSLLFAIFTLVFIKKQNHPVFHFFVYIAIFGGILNNLFPTYIDQAPSILHPRTITGLLHHTVSMFLGILIVINGEFKPAFKDSHWLPLGLFFYTSLGLFYMQAFSPRSDNTMNIAEPILPNLNWYTLYAIIIVLHLLALYAFETIKKKKQMNRGEDHWTILQ